MRRLVTYHFPVCLLATLLALFFGFLVSVLAPLKPVERAVENFSFTDIYYDAMSRVAQRDTNQLITIVDLTYLVNRSDIATTIRSIEAAQPRILGVDCTFDIEGKDPEGDAAILEVAESYPDIIWATKLYDWQADGTGWAREVHSFFTRYVDVREGTVNMPRGNAYDSMKRLIPRGEMLRGRFVPSLASQLADAVAPDDSQASFTTPETTHSADISINFLPQYFTVLSPDQVSICPELLRGRIVILGAVHEDIDMHWTPVGLISGPELEAYGIHTLHSQSEVRQPGIWLLALLSLLFVILMELLFECWRKQIDKVTRGWLRVLLKTDYFYAMFLTLISIVLIFGCFLLFVFCHVSINLTWVMSIMLFFGPARELFELLKMRIRTAKKTTTMTGKFRLLFLVLSGLSSLSVAAQDYTVYHVVGYPTCKTEEGFHPLVMNTTVSAGHILTLAEGDKVELLSEHEGKRIILAHPGTGTLAQLMSRAGVHISQVTKSFIAYVKSQMTNQEYVEQQRCADFACVTRQREEAQADDEDPFAAAFHTFQKEATRDFETFRAECNRKYLEFVRRNWESFHGRPAEEMPEERTVPPFILDEDHTILLTPRPQPTPQIKPIPALIADIPQPHPVSPIPEGEMGASSRMPFCYNGFEFGVRLNEAMRISLGTVTPDRIADALTFFSTEEYDAALSDVLRLRRQYAMCDWAYLQMLRTMSEQFCGEECDEAVLLTGYLAYQSGYKVRFAHDGNRLYVLFGTQYCIYGRKYYPINGSRYFTLEDDMPLNLRVCPAAYEGEQDFSLAIAQPVQTSSASTKAGSVHTIVSKKYGEFSLCVRDDEALRSFYATYPAACLDNDFTTHWVIYAQTPMNAQVREEAYPQLRQQLQGLTALDAVGRLLDLVQTGLNYEVDEVVWGRERAFFAEETLMYSLCDCEDRSILLTRLVRDLLGLPCCLIYYPGHLASAVHLPDGPVGAYYIVDGVDYTVCDGTFIHAGVGEQMSSVEADKAVIIPLR